MVSRCACVAGRRRTPFGRPVVPEVYIIEPGGSKGGPAWGSWAASQSGHSESGIAGIPGSPSGASRCGCPTSALAPLSARI